MAALASFLEGVDATPADKTVLTLAGEYFIKKLNVTTSDQLVGLINEDLADLPAEVPVRGLIRRAVSLATHEHEVKRRKTSAVTSVPTPMSGSGPFGVMDTVGGRLFSPPGASFSRIACVALTPDVLK